MKQQQQSNARFGLDVTELGPPLTARDYLSQRLLPRSRPGARVLGIEVVPESVQALSNQVRQAQEQIAKSGLRTQVKGDTARVRIAYQRQGQPEEEWLSGATYARGTPTPTYNPATVRYEQAMSYECGAQYLFGCSAPAGQLAASEKLFRAMLGSIRVDPQWQARVQQVHANIQAVKSKSAMKQAQIAHETAEYASKLRNDTYQRRAESQDRINERWSQTIRGVETYRNPTTGDTVELSNNYRNAWSNGKDEYLLSDTPGFDPNVDLKSKDNWTQMQVVEPGTPPREP